MKTVTCDLFRDGDYIMFNIQRLMELEAAVGKPIGELLQMPTWPINSIVSGYAIGMKHHKRNPQKYFDLIDDLLSKEGSDVSLLTLQAPLMKAIVASGAYGMNMYYKMFPDELTKADKLAIEEEAEQLKNQTGANAPPLFLCG